MANMANSTHPGNIPTLQQNDVNVLLVLPEPLISSEGRVDLEHLSWNCEFALVPSWSCGKKTWKKHLQLGRFVVGNSGRFTSPTQHVFLDPLLQLVDKHPNNQLGWLNIVKTKALVLIEHGKKHKALVWYKKFYDINWYKTSSINSIKLSNTCPTSVPLFQGKDVGRTGSAREKILHSTRSPMVQVQTWEDHEKRIMMWSWKLSPHPIPSEKDTFKRKWSSFLWISLITVSF